MSMSEIYTRQMGENLEALNFFLRILKDLYFSQKVIHNIEIISLIQVL